MSDWDNSPLTKPSLGDYEKAFAKLLLDLTGKKYDVRVDVLDRSPKWVEKLGIHPNEAAERTFQVRDPPWHPTE